VRYPGYQSLRSWSSALNLTVTSAFILQASTSKFATLTARILCITRKWRPQRSVCSLSQKN
jgi:hypothetical protein